MRLFVLAIALLAVPARAETLGVGLIVGSPTGISIKYRPSRDHALDAALGGTVAWSSGIQVHADYLFTRWLFTREPTFDLGPYLGIGGRLLDHSRPKEEDDDFHVGVRFPFGLAFDFTKTRVPLEAFVEVAVILDVIVDDDQGHDDDLDLALNAGLGIRYFF